MSKSPIGTAVEALEDAASVFRNYEQLHLAKEPPDKVKATRNAHHAKSMEQAKFILAGWWVSHIREMEHRDEVLRIERARFESAIRLLSAITLFMKPDKIQTPDGKVYEYHPSDEIVRQSWDGLTRAIREAQEFHRKEMG